MQTVVWSINIMCAILLICVAIVIYWIFKYDDWYPNPYINKHESERDGSRDEGVEVRERQNPH